MCISCGCGKVNDTHGDSRNITQQDLDQAAQAAGTTRDRVIQNIAQGAQSPSEQYTPSAQAAGDYYQHPSTKQPDLQSGETSPELGQDLGSTWQEDLQMGETERGGVENPQTNP